MQFVPVVVDPLDPSNVAKKEVPNLGLDPRMARLRLEGMPQGVCVPAFRPILVDEPLLHQPLRDYFHLRVQPAVVSVGPPCAREDVVVRGTNGAEVLYGVSSQVRVIRPSVPLSAVEVHTQGGLLLGQAWEVAPPEGEDSVDLDPALPLHEQGRPHAQRHGQEDSPDVLTLQRLRRGPDLLQSHLKVPEQLGVVPLVELLYGRGCYPSLGFGVALLEKVDVDVFVQPVRALPFCANVDGVGFEDAGEVIMDELVRGEVDFFLFQLPEVELQLAGVDCPRPDVPVLAE